MRPNKRTPAPENTIPRLNSEPLNTGLDAQPSPTPPTAESNPTPHQRTTMPRRPISLVVRNARKSRNKHPYLSVPRYNHYLLARSLVEGDQSPKSLTPGRDLRGVRKTVPPPFHNEALPPDFTVSDFIWQFSAPDSQIDEALAALKSCDPQTFNELVSGFD